MLFADNIDSMMMVVLKTVTLVTVIVMMLVLNVWVCDPTADDRSDDYDG